MEGGKKLPRLGFLGTGWIGRHRLEAVAAAGVAEIAAVADVDAGAAAAAAACAPGAQVVADVDTLLALGLDGIVIATPSAVHAGQAVAALERGAAVFCQKPLARTAAETVAVVAAARKADRLLGVDFSYRFTTGMQGLYGLARGGDLGEIYAADLVFHNAYGPDKPWFYDPRQSGGGCVMDLGSHLVDLALWLLDFPEIVCVSSTLYAAGKRISSAEVVVEDYAVASFGLSNGAVVRLACSWNLPAGCDAVIEASFYGTKGGATFRNVGGSFYDFVAERFHGTARETLASPPDAWGGRAAVAWARRLGESRCFDTGAERLVDVAQALDRVYGR